MAWMVLDPTRVQPLGVLSESFSQDLQTPEGLITVGKDLQEKGDAR
jgi:hypothetical protein